MTIMLKQYLYYKILQIYEKDGPESFRDDTAGGMYSFLDEDISNLIADFESFDMVHFWKSTPGKAILRQISNIPARGERDAALPRGARRGRQDRHADPARGPVRLPPLRRGTLSQEGADQRRDAAGFVRKRRRKDHK